MERFAAPASSASPHTRFAFSGWNRCGIQPSASSAACSTFFGPSAATQIGIVSRSGWVRIFSALPSPVTAPCSLSRGSWKIPSEVSGSRLSPRRTRSITSAVRASGLEYGTPWKPSITCGPLAPSPRIARPPETLSSPAAVCRIAPGVREYRFRIPEPISIVSVFAARYPISVGESKPYASGTHTVSSPACSSSTTWSAAALGLPSYISIWDSFMGSVMAPS